MAGAENKPHSFIRSTAGLLTAAAGFITAVAALVGALIAVGVIGGDADGTTTRATPTPIATCDATVLINIAERTVQREISGVKVAGGTLQACQKSYALLRIEPDNSRCPPACLDPLNFFFQIIRDEWQVIDYGSGITCSDPDLFFALREACRQLGLLRPS
jgi:hypothetical protein